ncbi:MAG: DEAD/DEAH box helicase, partial [Desulfobacula sp.]|nr:DEAD/DEAH box helicase [Desulfobacula sp.]
AVEAQGYTIPTPIQARAIPVVFQGRDILAGAQTGTGKTAAFALPILQRLSESLNKVRRPRALILAPTRELAAQVGESFETYGRHLSLRIAVIFGGVSINPQIGKLKRGVDILVATPGRLLDHLGRKTLDLSRIEVLVLDEADRMLDMGFIHDIRKVIKLLPANRQNMLFSATYSNEIKRLADGLLKSPALIEVSQRNTAAQGVTQRVYQVSQADKRFLLSSLIRDGKWSRALVFTRTKHRANKLTKQLLSDGVSAAAIHGNKSQATRTRALADFKSGAVKTLVATDIAARGLDIQQLPHVVNFDLPHVPEDYIHRIGRTGRAGANGIAHSLVSREEQQLLVGIERLLKLRIPVTKSGIRMPAAVSAPAPVVVRKKVQKTRKKRQNSGWLSSSSLKQMKEASQRAR